jgi:transcription elongation factor Elf1
VRVKPEGPNVEEKVTQMASHKLNCPQCGHLQDTVVWTSLNVSLDPNLKEKLFNEEINVFVCQECGNRALVSMALLYHDMDRQYCVQYYPIQAIEDPEYFKSFTKDGKLNINGLSKAMGNIGHYFTEPHIVFDLNEMIQYIKFRDKLHDLHKELIS